MDKRRARLAISAYFSLFIQKLALFILVFSLLFSPVAPVFAQDLVSPPPIITQENSDTSLKSNKRILPETDSSTGALKYTYPIIIPKGRGDMTPDIFLAYNSQNIDQQNIIGYSWSLSIPYITRVNKTGSEKIYSDNYFNSYFDGELVATSATEYIHKVENGNFFKYVYSNGYWIVTDKKRTIYKFGQSSGARQDDTAGVKVYKWMLEEVRDTNDNFISYT